MRSCYTAVRPEFTGTLAIKGGRHPVLECVQSAGATIPNDVYCCEASSFQIVQGPKCVSYLSLSMTGIFMSYTSACRGKARIYAKLPY